MKSPRVCSPKSKNQKTGSGGLTLVELLIVIGILVLLIITSIPMSINFYKTRTMDVSLNSIVQTLRRAQLKAMSVEGDSSFGVYFTSEKWVLFKGNSYLVRDVVYDEVFDLPKNLQLNGLSEIVFSKLRGTPSNTGNIILTIDNRTETININEVGRINY